MEEGDWQGEVGGLPERLSAIDYDLDLCAEDYQGRWVNNGLLDSMNSWVQCRGWGERAV